MGFIVFFKWTFTKTGGFLVESNYINTEDKYERLNFWAKF